MTEHICDLPAPSKNYLGCQFVCDCGVGYLLTLNGVWTKDTFSEEYGTMLQVLNTLGESDSIEQVQEKLKNLLEE